MRQLNGIQLVHWSIDIACVPIKVWKRKHLFTPSKQCVLCLSSKLRARVVAASCYKRRFAHKRVATVAAITSFFPFKEK